MPTCEVGESMVELALVLPVLLLVLVASSVRAGLHPQNVVTTAATKALVSRQRKAVMQSTASSDPRCPGFGPRKHRESFAVVTSDDGESVHGPGRVTIR